MHPCRLAYQRHGTHNINKQTRMQSLVNRPAVRNGPHRACSKRHERGRPKIRFMRRTIVVEVACRACAGTGATGHTRARSKALLRRGCNQTLL